MVSKSLRCALTGMALALSLSGCSGVEPPRAAQEATIGECALACNATGAWIFDDGESEWIADIWMKPDGIHVRNRETESVRFYKQTSLDNYRHEDGERLEFKTDDHMIRHFRAGGSLAQSRLKS